MTAEVSTPRPIMDAGWLRRKASRGLTQHQMVDAWEEETGIRVSRSTIAMAMRRFDVTPAHPRPRYEDMLPWHVKDEHKNHMDARLLRIEARRRRGEKLPPRKLKWLTGWRQRLAEADAVIMYDPNTEEGFFWVKREPGEEDIIRRPKD